MYFSTSLKVLQFIFNLVLILTISGVANSSTISSEASTTSHTGSEYLDENQNFLVKWNINHADKIIYFEIIAKTTGFVGFGISPKGGMAGADILIAGVYPNKTIYSEDYYATANAAPVPDSQNNWIITEAQEVDGVTTIRFHRLLSTCDEHDLEITDATMRLIWALGQTDTIQYHRANRGTKSVNFYLSDQQLFQPEKYSALDLIVNMTMPAQHTTYWCTFHRAPLFSKKQHFVGFDAVLSNPAALKHTHHFTIFRCSVPTDLNPETIFEAWVNSPGDNCYAAAFPNFPYLQYCARSPIFVWSKGGKRFTFPENMGLPMPEVVNRREYYAIEIHYDNPEVIANLAFPTGGRLYYTENTRPVDVGLLIVDHHVDPTLVVPPKVSDFVVTGHCSSKCTENYMPPEGITIFSNLFHSHLAGRKAKLRHFRGNEELPWIDVDQYFDFNFQQNKPLKNGRRVLRGDQLTVECSYDSTSAKDGKAIIGGLGTRDEMCESILYYYPRIELQLCGSAKNMDSHMNLLGIKNYSLKYSAQSGFVPEVTILEPRNMAANYRDFISANVDWSSDFLETFQKEERYGTHVGQCLGWNEIKKGPVSYPQGMKEYVPPNQCSAAATIGWFPIWFHWLLALLVLIVKLVC